MEWNDFRLFSLCHRASAGQVPTDQWIEAVRWHGDTKIAGISHTDAEWADAKTLLATLENVVVEAESKQAVVWSSAQNDLPTIPTDFFPLQLIVSTGNEIQRHLPGTLHVEATGLGVGTSRILSFGMGYLDPIG